MSTTVHEPITDPAERDFLIRLLGGDSTRYLARRIARRIADWDDLQLAEHYGLTPGLAGDLREVVELMAR